VKTLAISPGKSHICVQTCEGSMVLLPRSCLNCCCEGSCDWCTFALLVYILTQSRIVILHKYNMAANCHCTDFGFGLICRVHRGAYPGVLRRRRAIQLQPWGSLWLTWLHRLPSAVCACALGRHSLDRGRLQVHRQWLAEWALRLSLHPGLAAIG